MQIEGKSFGFCYNRWMRRTLLIFILLSIGLSAGFHADISLVTPEIKQRMTSGNSYKGGCPVSLEDLRYVTLTYKDFNHNDQQGELVVHKDVAGEVVKIFETLYEAGYPIRQMRLVSDFGGNDWQSIEADNTSAFNCRNATGSKKFSRHSFGKAIDINPLENPYVFTNGHTSHKVSKKYLRRVHQKDTAPDRAVLLQNDKAVKLFQKYGWQWGGEFRGEKDYQHFQK